MSPDAFMALAEQLMHSPAEAERRTAVSRAYYAAFHVARQMIVDCGVYLPETAEAHAKILLCLHEVGTKTIQKSASRLGTIRGIRNHADYSLNDPRFGETEFVIAQVIAAKNVASLLASVNLGEIREPLRKYAKEILKLRVSATP